MKHIDISTPKHPNTFALVDDEDFDKLNQYKWSAYRVGKSVYAVRNDYLHGKRALVLLHRSITNVIQGKEVDHINHNGLDNQKLNLRVCTRAENSRNQQIKDVNSSGFKGVCWDKQNTKWVAKIQIDGKVINIGRFFCLVKAARAYDEAARKYHGDFACLNF